MSQSGRMSHSGVMGGKLRVVLEAANVMRLSKVSVHPRVQR